MVKAKDEIVFLLGFEEGIIMQDYYRQGVSRFSKKVNFQC